MFLGVDTGGTFTDFVLVSKDSNSKLALTTHKVLSTPEAPEHAILQGIDEMNLTTALKNGKIKIIHGSTVATNALLERKGVRTAFITNKGFKDMLKIARQTRPELYQLEIPEQIQPVPDELCLEVECRLDASGRVIKDSTLSTMQGLLQQLEQLKPEAIAINLLFSFINDSHELELEQYLRKHLSCQPFICRSSIVLPEYKEYERGIATWLNASLGPLVESYLLRLKNATDPAPLSIMQSSGGTIDTVQASRNAVNLLLSGPAGGLAAAAFLARTLDQKHLLTFDMGGTSTDVALINGRIQLSTEGSIAQFPVAVPMVDMHTIGAGGGSIAYVDDGGLLQVGPQSAGASPGPACYQKGGIQATVTDANLVLGRLLPAAFMGGKVTISKEEAINVIAPLAEKLKMSIEACASGIVQITNEHMARALRVISIERGHDPLNYRLCSFGGAGGLHVCALADALGMQHALVPAHAGVLSALGMYLAPIERQLSRSYQHLLSKVKQQELNILVNKLKVEGAQQLLLEQVEESLIQYEVSADLRYNGQSSSINIHFSDLDSLDEEFQHAHHTRYGHRLSKPVELVTIRVAVFSANNQQYIPALINSDKPAPPCQDVIVHGYEDNVPVFQRKYLTAEQNIDGPALITEDSSTIFIESTWTANMDRFGHLFLTRKKQS